METAKMMYALLRRHTRHSALYYTTAAVAVLGVVAVITLVDMALPADALIGRTILYAVTGIVAAPLIAAVSQLAALSEIAAETVMKNPRLFLGSSFKMNTFQAFFPFSLLLGGFLVLMTDVNGVPYPQILKDLSLLDLTVLSSLAVLISQTRPQALFLPRLYIRFLSGQDSKETQWSIVEDDHQRNILLQPLAITRQVYLGLLGGSGTLMAWVTLQSSGDVEPVLIALTCVWFAVSTNTTIQLLHEAGAATDR